MPNKKIFSYSTIAITFAIAAALLFAAPAAAQNSAYPQTPPWAAKWIWCPGCEAQPHNFYLYLRKEFDLPSRAISSKARVTADSRYTLYVNGARIGRGPVKSDRQHLYYDTWDISLYLKPGKNVIAALVHHYGEWTFSYQLGRGGFLLESNITLDNGKQLQIVSDSTWKTLPAESWKRDLGRMTVQLGFNEIYDSRKAPDGWNAAGYDDSAWLNAEELGAPPLEPWPNLHPRATPPHFEELFRPKQVIRSGDILPGLNYQGVDFGSLFGSKQSTTAYAATFIYSPKETGIKILLYTKSACRVWIGNKPLMSNYITQGVGLMDKIENRAALPAGWTPLLIKCVKDRETWSFDIAVDSAGAGEIIFSALQDKGKPGWAAIGPFAKSGSPDMFTEMKAVYPPQKEIDFSAKYSSAGGKDVAWKTVSDSDTYAARLAYALAHVKTAETKTSSFTNLAALTDSAGDMSRTKGASVRSGPDGAAYFILDFGWEVSGFPRIELESRNGGETIDLCYAEVLEDEGGNALSPLKPEGRVNCSRGQVNYADRYITRPGYQTWETFEKRAFRFMLVVVRNADEPVAFKNIGLRFSTYDTGARGSFESSSEMLNRIWKVGAYTLQLNMDDSYTDCPWRERGQWWGDARIEILVNYYAFGDTELARRGILQIGESQRDDGLVAGIYPTDWDNRWLPDYALIWITSAMDYYRFTGDASILPELYPRFHKMLDGFFLSRENADHLLTDVPGWVFIDWAPVEKRGSITALNAFYYRALMDAAALFRAGGKTEDAGKYEARAARLRDSINKFMWNEEKGAYADCYAGGSICSTISEQANSLAIAFDIAPREKQPAILKAISPDSPGIVRAGSPYFSFYLLDGMRHAGDDKAAMAYINRWKEMLQWGATTWWEVWNAGSSHCHAWSSAPTYDLSRNVLGVWPEEPGFAKISIEPRPGELAYASGVVPTARGGVSVNWLKKEKPSSFEITYTAPKDSPSTFWAPDGKYDLLKAEVDGATKKLPRGVKLVKREDGKSGFEFATGGTHTIKLPPE